MTTTSTKSSTGEGTGLTREDAINNAIIEAIGKMSGVSINSLKKSNTSVSTDNSGSNIQDNYSEQFQKPPKVELILMKSIVLNKMQMVNIQPM